jgi:hypothetical protein
MRWRTSKRSLKKDVSNSASAIAGGHVKAHEFQRRQISLLRSFPTDQANDAVTLYGQKGVAKIGRQSFPPTHFALVNI